MGLLDVLNGMQNGPRGPSTPSSEKVLRRHVADDHGAPRPARLEGIQACDRQPARRGAADVPHADAPPPPVNAGAGGGLGGALGGGGGLGDLLKGGLGGLLAGGAAGSVLSGGLGDLLNQLQQGGHGETASTWVGKGKNKAIAPGDLANALGADQIESLATQSGLSRDELLSGLSQYLPKVIDHLTPDGRLPTENELSGRILILVKPSGA